MRILYLTYDLSDAASIKRVRMLKAGGAEVEVMGFRRCRETIDNVEGCRTIDLGQSYNARFVQRALLVVRSLIRNRHRRSHFAQADVIVARNLEMLAIAVHGRRYRAGNPAPIAYESLDIHRLLLRRDGIGWLLRTLEGWLSRQASLLITSSPAFIREYFEPLSSVRLPTLLIENKTFPNQPLQRVVVAPRPPAPPWRIGWFGALRCRKSLALLAQVARTRPDLIACVLRGRPSYDQIPDFDAATNTLPALRYEGTYQNPEALEAIYADVHFTWAIDQFEAGMNSEWLLPNRLYEGGCYGSVPLAVHGTETGRYITALGIGHSLESFSAEALEHFLSSLTPASYAALAQASGNVSIHTWQNNTADCAQLVQRLTAMQAASVAPTLPPADATLPLLVVIPCLNEQAHIGGLLDYLIREAQQQPMTIVVADGGSTDQTAAIAQRYASQYAFLHYLHNPKRIQSAALNLAVSQYGTGHHFLLRVDAHAHYPQGYCTALRDEAIRTGADSVVVAMHTLGLSPLQKAVAAAQNSPLGNGGAAHRNKPAHGRWVDHGHHALMRIAAFEHVGGYDEQFRHNEDAELDQRLRSAGYRIWLTAATALDYYPRATLASLFRQYRNYGFGRLQNLRKHRTMPRIRQALPIAILPAILLALMTPAYPVAALPLAFWSIACLGYGLMIALRAGSSDLVMSGPAAMVMHSGWSLGFWQGLCTTLRGNRP